MPEVSPYPTAAAATPRHYRVGRWLFALAFVGLPLLGIGGLAALWVRSCWVEESWTGQRNQKRFDPLTRIDTEEYLDLTVFAPRGLLAFSLDILWDWSTINDPAKAQAIRTRRALAPTVEWSHDTTRFNHLDPPPIQMGCCGFGARLTGAEAFGLAPHADRPCSFLDDPDRPLNLPRNDHGLRPLTYWSWQTTDDNFAEPSGNRQTRVFVVAPIWVGMLPLLGPILWWCWCPRGRVVPRLSLRRTCLVTAWVGLILALLCRPPATDHAVLTLNGLGADWYYGPDPAQPGRPTLIGASLSSVRHNGDTWTPAEIEALQTALVDLAQLRYLTLTTETGPPSLMTSLLPERWPNLEVLLMPAAQADDSTVARLGAGYPRLQRLDLAWTHVTDAGLASLRRLPDLADLTLGKLPLTDAGLVHLHGLPRLRRLDFDSRGPNPQDTPTALSDVALRNLADSLPDFEELTRPDGSVLTRHPYQPGPPPPPGFQ